MFFQDEFDARRSGDADFCVLISRQNKCLIILRLHCMQNKLKKEKSEVGDFNRKVLMKETSSSTECRQSSQTAA